MNTNHKELLSIIVTCVILALTVLILHRFLGCVAWASVLGITTYPLYKKWEKCFGKYQQTAAFLFTSLLFLLLMIPVSWIITVLITETQIFINYLQNKVSTHLYLLVCVCVQSFFVQIQTQTTTTKKTQHKYILKLRFIFL